MSKPLLPNGATSVVVSVMLPATFIVDPETRQVFFPTPGRKAQRVTDPRVLKIVLEEYERTN